MIGGTKKMLIFDDMRLVDKLTIYDQGIVKKDKVMKTVPMNSRCAPGDILVPYIPHEDALRNSVEHFADCVENGRPSLSGPEPGAARNQNSRCGDGETVNASGF